MKCCAAPHTVEYNPSIESQVAVTSLRLEPQGHAAIAKVLYKQAIANVLYRGTSLIRKRTLLGTYRRPMSRVLGGS